jgi:hypothetical protein
MQQTPYRPLEEPPRRRQVATRGDVDVDDLAELVDRSVGDCCIQR